MEENISATEIYRLNSIISFVELPAYLMAYTNIAGN